MDVVRACEVLKAQMTTDPSSLDALIKPELSETPSGPFSPSSSSQPGAGFDRNSRHKIKSGYCLPSSLLQPPFIRMPVDAERLNGAEYEKQRKEMLWKVKNLPFDFSESASDVREEKNKNSQNSQNSCESAGGGAVFIGGGGMAPLNDPGVFLPDYLWASEVYGNGVIILDWVVERWTSVQGIIQGGDVWIGEESEGEWSQQENAHKAAAKKKKPQRQQQSSDYDFDERGFIGMAADALSSFFSRVRSSIPTHHLTSLISLPVLSNHLLSPLIMKTLPKLYTEFGHVCSSNSIDLKRAALIKSELNGAMYAYFEEARTVVEEGVYNLRETKGTSLYLNKQMEQAITAGKKKSAWTTSLHATQSTLNSFYAHSQVSEPLRLSRHLSHLSAKISRILLPWINVSTALVLRHFDFEFMNTEAIYTTAGLKLFEMDEFHRFELRKLKNVCKVLSTLAPVNREMWRGFSAASKEEEDYCRLVIDPFLNSHFNGVTSTPEIFVGQLLRVLVLVKTGNLSRPDIYGSNDPLSCIPKADLLSCQDDFDPELFIALYEDWKSSSKKLRELLSSRSLAIVRSKLRRLEIKGEFESLGESYKGGELRQLAVDHAKKRDRAKQKFGIVKQMVEGLIYRELGVQIHLAETNDVQDWVGLNGFVEEISGYDIDGPRIKRRARVRCVFADMLC